MSSFVASASASSCHPMTAFEAIAAKKDATIPASIIAADTVTMNTLISTIQGPLETFTLFGGLPMELQLKIWAKAADDIPGRAIYAYEVENDAPTQSPGNSRLTAAKFEVFGGHRPSMFGVCKQSREIAAQLGYKSIFQIRGTKKAVFFHPDLDCLLIHSELLFKVPQSGQLSLSEHLENPSDAEYIHHLRVPLKTFQYDPIWIMDNIKGLPSLEVLTLGGIVHTFPHSCVSSLRMTFEDRDGDRKILLPIFNMLGSELTSEVAIEAISKYLPGCEMEHLYETSKLLRICLHQLENFPSYIQLYLKCIELIDEFTPGRIEAEQ